MRPFRVVALAFRDGHVPWLGDKLKDSARLGISTVAVRVYLGRTVEHGPIHFLEPHLTEAKPRIGVIGRGHP